MKRSIIILSILTLTLGFVGCSSSTKTVPVPKAKAPVVQKKVVPTVAPEGTKDTGKGTIETTSPSGNSKDGVVPFLYVAKDTSLEQVGLNAWEFNGAKLSYIFVDGVLNSKEQLVDTQTSLNITGDALKLGKHKVEVTQYDTDKIGGKIITYKLGGYEIKSK